MQKNYHVSSSVGISRFPLYFLVNEKVQKQLGASGCGLFALAFANQSKLRSSKDSRAFNISAALKAEQVLLFQKPLGEFPITYILR